MPVKFDHQPSIVIDRKHQFTLFSMNKKFVADCNFSALNRMIRLTRQKKGLRQMLMLQKILLLISTL